MGIGRPPVCLAPRLARGRGVAAVLAGLAVAVGVLAAWQVWAKDTFRNVAIGPVAGTFLVYKDVNVRAEPSAKSENVGNLSYGARIQPVGVTKDGWYAVEQDGREWGFVFRSFVLPMINGALSADILGKAQSPLGAACDYAVSFLGKSEVPDVPFETADYEVAWACDLKGTKLEFGAFMFITEAPYALSEAAVYQISLDLREVGEDWEEMLSTIILFDRDRNIVRLEAVSLPDYRAAAPIKDKPATDVPQALTGAVELAIGAWNSKVWDSLAKATR